MHPDLRPECTTTRISTPRPPQVQEGDGSSRLDYASTGALSAGAGDILRASANPSTPADLALPAKGAAGSLGWSSEVMVDSSAGYILDVRYRRRLSDMKLLFLYRGTG